INVLRMGLLAFAVGGALGGLAGVLVTPVQQVSFDSDVALVVNGFSAAILGNLTRPGLTPVGGLLLGVVQALVGGYPSTSYQTEVAMLFMLAVLIARAGRVLRDRRVHGRAARAARCAHADRAARRAGRVRAHGRAGRHPDPAAAR